jgi:hypothetical protein
VKENKQDTDGAHVFNKEDIEVEHASISQSAHIGKLVANNLVWYIPSDKDTCQESDCWQEELSGNKIEHVEDGHSK